jgi:hypothetical protein
MVNHIGIGRIGVLGSLGTWAGRPVPGVSAAVSFTCLTYSLTTLHDKAIPTIPSQPKRGFL